MKISDYFALLSNTDWELIRVNSQLVISNLEKATLVDVNKDLLEKLSLEEFEKNEIMFHSEEKIAVLEEKIKIYRRINDERDRQILSLQNQLIRSDSFVTASQLEKECIAKVNQQKFLDLAIVHQEKISLLRFERDEIEINLREELNELKMKMSQENESLKNENTHIVTKSQFEKENIAKVNQQKFLDLAIVHQEKISLLQFERDEIMEINLHEELNELKAKMSHEIESLKNENISVNAALIGEKLKNNSLNQTMTTYEMRLLDQEAGDVYVEIPSRQTAHFDQAQYNTLRMSSVIPENPMPSSTQTNQQSSNNSRVHQYALRTVDAHTLIPSQTAERSVQNAFYPNVQQIQPNVSTVSGVYHNFSSSDDVYNSISSRIIPNTTDSPSLIAQQSVQKTNDRQFQSKDSTFLHPQLSSLASVTAILSC